MFQLFFPDVKRIVSTILPGNKKIAVALAIGIEKSRIISFNHNGIFISKEDPVELFSLEDTIEKIH